MARETMLVMGLLAAAGLVSGAAWLASSPGSPRSAAAAEQFEPPAAIQAQLATPASKATVGASFDARNPPASLTVTYAGTTVTLPLFSQQAGPPYNPDGYIVVYQTPLNVAQRWRVHVMPQQPGTMHFGIYDGNWLFWKSMPFANYSDAYLTISVP